MAKNNATYWRERQEQLHRAMERDEAQLNRDLARFYEKEAKKLEKEIAAYYEKYGVDGVIEYRRLMETLPAADQRLLIENMDAFAAKYPQHADVLPVRESIYKLNRLEGLQASIQMQQLEIGAYTEEELGKHLEKWASQNYAAALGIAGGPFATVNPNIAAIVTSTKWIDGMNFSDRIWKNQERLTQYMQQDFAAAVVRGDGYDQMIRQMQHRFDVGRTEAKRLVWTEGTYVSEEAAARAFEQVGLDNYRFWTEHDEKTCARCSPIDGQVFPFEERQPGVNFPPIHPNCRCGFEVVTDRDAGRIDYALSDGYFGEMGDPAFKALSHFTPEEVIAELQKTEMGREVLEWIDKSAARPVFDYTPQMPLPDGSIVRGSRSGDQVFIYAYNNRDAAEAARTVIHEMTHAHFDIGSDQWAEVVCKANEARHQSGRMSLTRGELEAIIQEVKRLYPKLPWRKK